MLTSMDYKVINYVITAFKKYKPNTNRIKSTVKVGGDPEKHGIIEATITEDKKDVAKFIVDLESKKYTVKMLKKGFNYPFTEEYIRKIMKELDVFFKRSDK